MLSSGRISPRALSGAIHSAGTNSKPRTSKSPRLFRSRLAQRVTPNQQVDTDAELASASLTLLRDEPHLVSKVLEEARPAVRAQAGLHTDQARWRRSHQLQQRAARDVRTLGRYAACRVGPVQGEHVLGEIDAKGDNGQGNSAFVALVSGLSVPLLSNR